MNSRGGVAIRRKERRSSHQPGSEAALGRSAGTCVPAEAQHSAAALAEQVSQALQPAAVDIFLYPMWSGLICEKRALQPRKAVRCRCMGLNCYVRELKQRFIQSNLVDIRCISNDFLC